MIDGGLRICYDNACGNMPAEMSFNLLDYYPVLRVQYSTVRTRRHSISTGVLEYWRTGVLLITRILNTGS